MTRSPTNQMNKDPDLLQKLELLERHAREMAGMPENWHATEVKSVPQESGFALEVIGQIPDDPTTKQAVVITPKAHAEWLIGQIQKLTVAA